LSRESGGPLDREGKQSLISKEKIEEIKEKANIVQIISEYVQLKKRGKNYLGLCPFHSEKTPSFTVSEEKQMFHCFGCGKGGNIFAFLMEYEKVDFPESVKLVGEKTGIEVQIQESNGILKGYKDQLLNLMDLACKFYEKNLDETHGEAARAYLLKRGLSPAQAKLYRLGYAQNNWDSLFKYLVSRGAKTEDLESSGLILSRKEQEGYYDRFRNRLIFPIFDLHSRVIGFSGRSLGDEEPKYLNSPDSPIFMKGENLFGLNLAKEEIKKKKFALLVEGNVDVLSCQEAGFKNTVAPLGTAFTPFQAKLLGRFAETVVVAFDQDPAGRAASDRAVEILKDAGIKTRITELKDHKDPDEFIKAEGKEAFLETIKKSKPAYEYKILRIISRFNISNIESRAQASHEIASFLAKEKDPIVQSEYIKLAAQLLKIEEVLLHNEVKRRSSINNISYKGSRGAIPRPPHKIIEAEKNLIRLAVESEEAFLHIKENVSADDFVDPNFKYFMAKLLEVPGKDLAANLESEEQKKILREILIEDKPITDFKQIADDCIQVIKEFHLKEEISKIRAALEIAQKTGNYEEERILNSEYNRLSEIFRNKSR